GSNDDFGKYFIDGFSCRQIQFFIYHDNTAKRRFGIRLEGFFPGGVKILRSSNSAGHRMFEDGAGGISLLVISNEPEGSVNIQKVIVTELLAVETVDKCILIAINCGLLMRVFAVSQLLWLGKRDIHLVSLFPFSLI